MNHGSFYLHFKALEHSNSLKKRELVVQTIQSNGFINIPQRQPRRILGFCGWHQQCFFLSLSQCPQLWGWSHQRGEVWATQGVLFIFNVLVRSRQDMVTGSHGLERGCLMLGVWQMSIGCSVNNMKAPDGKVGRSNPTKCISKGWVHVAQCSSRPLQVSEEIGMNGK